MLPEGSRHIWNLVNVLLHNTHTLQKTLLYLYRACSYLVVYILVDVEPSLSCDRNTLPSLLEYIWIYQ